jgi:hypothetical protein
VARHLCRSLGTTERPLAHLRALRLSAAFEEVLLSHAKALRSRRPLTRWEREQILCELYDRILDECQTWAAQRNVATEFMGPGDPDWEVDRYFNPANLASFWTTLYQCGEYAEAADRLDSLLASRSIELPPDSVELKCLAAEGMRYAIAAFKEAERTIVAAELDEGTLARLARRHGRTPTPGGAAPQPSETTALPVPASGRPPRVSAPAAADD